MCSHRRWTASALLLLICIVFSLSSCSKTSSEALIGPELEPPVSAAIQVDGMTACELTEEQTAWFLERLRNMVDTIEERFDNPPTGGGPGWALVLHYQDRTVYYSGAARAYFNVETKWNGEEQAESVYYRVAESDIPYLSWTFSRMGTFTEENNPGFQASLQ